MQGARVLVEMLKAYQVEYIFGVPGDTSVSLYEALYDAKSDITHVMARDERSATFMADAYARLSYKPGVSECPSGAGPLYAIPGVAEANASSIPMILITSDIPLSGEGKQTITELDCQSLYQSVTKWSTVIKSVEKIPESIRRAFRIATTGRPGAVHLAVPQESLNGTIDGLEAIEAGDFDAVEPNNGRFNIIYGEDECCSYPAYRTRGARRELEKLVEFLVDAGKLLIVAGGGANHSQAGKIVGDVAEWLKAPVVTTISGQGIIPDDHPLALGVIGDNGFHPHAHKAVAEADTILYIGCKMGSVSTINWTLPAVDSGKRILQIDLNPEIMGNNYRNSLSIAGDAKLILEDLLVLLKGRITQRTDSIWMGQLNEARSAFWQEEAAMLSCTDTPLKPHRIVDELNKHLTTESVVISDAGTPTPYVTRFLRMGGNGSRFLIPRSYGGLGYAIPAMVGAHYARPNAKLVGLFGDGSFSMSAGELETLARLKIPCVLLHFNNRMFGWIKALQKIHSDEKYHSVDFTPGDPVMVAKGFGIEGIRVESAADLESAMAHAFAASGPVFLDILSEPETDRLPPVYSWLKHT